MSDSIDTVPKTELGLVAATFTAFHADGSLNLDAIERQAALLVQQEVRGAFVCGTSGEFASLTVPERSRVPRMKSRSMRFKVSSRTRGGQTPRIDLCDLSLDVGARVRPPASVGRDLGTSSPVLELVNIA